MKALMLLCICMAGYAAQDQAKVGALTFKPPDGWKATAASGPAAAIYAPGDLASGVACQIKVFPDETEKEAFRGWFEKKWQSVGVQRRKVLRTSEYGSVKLGELDILVRSAAYQEGAGEAYVLLIGLACQAHFVVAAYESNDYALMDKRQDEVYAMFETLELGASAAAVANTPPPTAPREKIVMGKWVVLAYLPAARKNPKNLEDMPQYMTLFGSDRACVGYPSEGFDDFDIGADVEANPDRWLKIEATGQTVKTTDIRSKTTSWTSKSDGSMQTSDGKVYAALSPVKAEPGDLTLGATPAQSLTLKKDGTVTDAGLLAAVGVPGVTAAGKYTLGAGSILLQFPGRKDARLVFLGGPGGEMLLGGVWVTAKR